MDALEYLKTDHREHERLLSEASEDAIHYGALKQAIVHHVRVEEKIFFPELLKIEAVEPIVREAWEEHNLCMQLLQELDEEKTGTPTWRAKLNVLKKVLEGHIENEEMELFPKLRKLLPGDELNQVGELLRNHKYDEATNDILYPEIPGSHQSPDLVSADKVS